MNLGRDAWRLVAARFVSRSGGEAAFFVGIWGKAAFELDATAGELALLIAATGVAGLIGSPVGGVLIDRYDPRRVLLIGEVVFVPVALSFLAVETIPQIIAAAFGLGLVGVPIYTALASMPPYLTRDPDELARVNAGVETAGMAALIAGTAAGAMFARWVSIDAIFIFDAVTSLVAVALVAGVRLRPSPAESSNRSGWRELREGLRFSYGHERLRFYILAGTSLWLLFGLFGALEPLFFRDVLGTGVEAIGWVNSVFGVGLVIGSVTAPRLPAALRGATGILVLLLLNGIGANLYIGFTDVNRVAVGGFLWGIAIGWFAPVVRTLIHLNSPHDLVGRVTGTTQMHAEAAKLAPLVFAPLLAQRFGVQDTMRVAGAVIGLGGLLFWSKARRFDATRAQEVRPAPVDPEMAPRAPGLHAPVVEGSDHRVEERDERPGR